MICGVTKILGLSMITGLLKKLLLLMLWSSFKSGSAYTYRSTAILIIQSTLRVRGGLVIDVANRCCHLGVV